MAGHILLYGNCAWNLS